MNTARRVMLWCGVLLVFLTLAVWATWPLARHFKTALPMGTEPVATVPLFNAWTIWWNSDRAQHGLSSYWNAPIFHPTHGTFAFSEPQPTTLAVAPLVWGFDTPIAAYNVYLLAALTLNGWSTFWLVRRLQGNTWAALCGGAMMELLPFVHWQLGVLQLVPVFGIVWTIHALLRFGEQASWRRGVILGLAFGVAYLLCAYHGLFLSVLLIVAGGWLLERRLIEWQAWRSLLFAAATFLIVAGPVIVTQRQVTQDPEFVRERELLLNLSAEPGDYAVSPWPQLISTTPLATAERVEYWKLSAGTIKTALALLGVMVGLCVSRWRRWTLFCVTFFVGAFLLSQGPKLKLGEWEPYQLLIDYYPGFAYARNVFRFALFAQLMVVFLATLGLEAIACVRWNEWRARTRRGQSTSETNTGDGIAGHVLVGLAITIAGLVAALEMLPARQPLFFPPKLAANQGWIDYLRLRTRDDAIVVCVPFPTGTTVKDYFGTGIWMYWQTFHGRRMVNGYSGFFPGSFVELRDAMAGFPDESVLPHLERTGVTHVIVFRDSVPRPRIVMHPVMSKRLIWEYGDDASRVDIYRFIR